MWVEIFDTRFGRRRAVAGYSVDELIAENGCLTALRGGESTLLPCDQPGFGWTATDRIFVMRRDMWVEFISGRDQGQNYTLGPVAQVETLNGQMSIRASDKDGDPAGRVVIAAFKPTRVWKHRWQANRELGIGAFVRIRVKATPPTEAQAAETIRVSLGYAR